MSSDRRSAPSARSSSSAPRRTNDRYDRDERPQRTERVREPHIADEIKADQLDKSIALELRTLPDGLAEIVARHLVAADLAMQNEDFALAAEHVGAAKRRAGRSSVVREAAGIVAYQSGNFAEALTDLRAVRRMTGSNALLPLIADCERGLGKPQKALDTIKAVANSKLSPELRSELLIVSAGARADMGKIDAAIVTLQVPELTKLQPGTPRARLQYAYADLLLTAGRLNEAWEWMERAAGSDIDGETDAAERCEEFAGISFIEEEIESE
jgi:tetratricopeptide (TPR) repeat protein